MLQNHVLFVAVFAFCYQRLYSVAHTLSSLAHLEDRDVDLRAGAVFEVLLRVYVCGESRYKKRGGGIYI